MTFRGTPLSSLALILATAACSADADPSQGTQDVRSQGEANPCATTGEPVLIAKNTFQEARDVVSDGEFVYWTTWGEENLQQDGMIMKAPIGGGPEVVLASSGEPTIGITVNADTVFYWGGAMLQSVPKSGGTPKTLTNNATGEAVVDGDFVYFTNGMGVNRVPVAGGDVELLARDSNGAKAIAVDESQVYWVERGTVSSDFTAVMRAPKTGGPPTVLTAEPGLFKGAANTMKIGLDAENVYVSSMPDGTLWKVPKAGGDRVAIATGLICPASVVTDGAEVYVANNAVACAFHEPDVRTRGVMRVPVSGGAPLLAGRGQRVGIGGGFSLDQRNIYWGGGGGVYCAPT